MDARKVEDFSMTHDAKYAAIAVKGARSRGVSLGYSQVILCRPPYFTALEVYLGGLCYTNAQITEDQKLYVQGGNVIANALNECPLERTQDWPVRYSELPFIDAEAGPASGFDQQGRLVEIAEGQIFAGQGSDRKLVFDGNFKERHSVPPPEWATQW